jgi:hypothetical protein
MIAIERSPRRGRNLATTNRVVIGGEIGLSDEQTSPADG